MNELPTGIVTFLHTDVESGTELLRTLGNQFTPAFEEHRSLLLEAFGSHGGVVVNSVADSFLIAFASATNAVEAAADGQRTLANHRWPAGADFRVRMGLDTGEATPYAGAYSQSLEVNRGARVCGLAHGGQVLLTQATADLAQSSLEENLGLRSLGDFAVRDFGPTHLYELVVDGHFETRPLRSLGLQTEEITLPKGGDALRFVNRGDEIGRMRARLKGALTGRSGFVLLSGEPGIGKTRLVEELASEAAAQGLEVVWGRCQESEGLPSYWPWIQILRGLTINRAPIYLRSQLGTGATRVAELVHELRDWLPELHDAESDIASGDPPAPDAGARFQLFDAIATFLSRASRSQPMLLLLDDLHRAAEESLLLIGFLLEHLSDARLLIIGTARDVGADRRGPLGEFLRALHRERVRGFEQIQLEGLEQEAVGELVTSFFEQPLDARGWALAHALCDETNGNPFFVQEELRYLVENERIFWQAGVWTSDARSIADLGLPETISDVLRQRLEHLSGTATELLTQAAVIGRGFDALTLQVLSRMDDDTLDGALDEAESAGIIEQSPDRFGRYRFFHALYREELYRQLPTRRRARVHQQVADAIELQYATRLDSHLSELAYHYVQGRQAGSADRAIEYARRAGEQALTTYAYEEAVRHFEAALSVLDRGGTPNEALRCDLLLALAGALLPSGEAMRSANQVAPGAFEIAERLQDRQRAFRACRAAIEALLRIGISRAMNTEQYRMWLERAARYADPGTNDELWADIRLQFAEGSLGHPGRAWEGRVRSLERASGCGDESLLCLALNSMLAAGTPGQFKEQARLAQSYADYQWQSVSIAQRSSFAVYCASKLLDSDNRAGWEAQREKCMGLASLTRDPYALFWVSYLEHEQLLLDGRLEEDIALQRRVLQETRNGGMQLAGLTLAVRSGSRSRLLLGRASENLTLRAQYCSAAGTVENPRDPGAVLAKAYLGRHEEVHDDLDWLVTSKSELSEQETFALVQYLEAAVLVEHTEAAAQLSEILAAAENAAICRLAYASAARHLADAANLVNKPDMARAYATKGLEISARIGNRPEIALSHLQIATFLLDPALRSGERPPREAIEHLVLATADLSEMKMQPSLERAVALRRRLPAGSWPHGTS